MELSVQSQNLVDNYGYEEAYKMIREAGFTAIDWNLDHAWSFRKLKNAEELRELCVFEKELPEILTEYENELNIIRENGLKITQAHAPFPAYEYGREDILEYALGIYKKMISFCDTVGCPRLIIHGISARFGEELSQQECSRLNYHLYESLIPTLIGTDVTVCLENLFTSHGALGTGFREGICSDPYEAAEMIDALNAKTGEKHFGLCLDTGHINLLRIDFRKYIPVVGDRVCALHIHDNDQTGDRHLAPYTGNILWSEVLAELKKIGYAGDLSFETFAQVNASRLPRELVPPFLTLIAEIGKYFKAQLA